MNRRGFLGSLLAAATLDPERLLWVPGKKHISIPKPQIPLLDDGDWHYIQEIWTRLRGGEAWLVRLVMDGMTVEELNSASYPFTHVPRHFRMMCRYPGEVELRLLNEYTPR